ncbi:MAG: GtrA family protein [Minisyncoccia bacterium]
MRRFFRYTLVGVSTLLFDLGLLYLLTSIAGVPYYLSTPISFCIAVSINYAVSRNIVFRGTKRPWGHGYLYFAGVALLGASVTTGLVAALVAYLGLYYLFARILVAGVVGMGNYFFNLYVNFNVAGRSLTP